MNSTASKAQAKLPVELPVGAHVVTPRRGYTHHGIHIGDGMVIHYAGLSTWLRRGPVACVTLVEFSGGHEVRIRCEDCPLYCGHDAARRACSRLGEDRYSLTRNNCEHLCNWCLHGVNRSTQAERLLALPRAMVQTLCRLAALLAPAARGTAAA